MKKLLLVIFLSYGAVYFLMDKAYWSKVNPDHFEKSETQARMVIDAREQQKTAQLAKPDSLHQLRQPKQ